MNTTNKSLLDKALSHIQEEIGLPNIRTSIQSNYQMIQKAHDSIHEFMYLVSFCLPPEVSWHSKSAFLTYHWEAFHQAHRSLLEALSGYYNAAYVLLRSTLELLLKGAFWECLAHKNFRDKATALDKDKGKGKRRSVKDWVEALIEQEPSVRKDLEETSEAIFDKTAILFSDREFQKRYVHIPSFPVIIKQLIEWQIVDIPNALDTIYENLYRNLSKDVHVIPDATDVGRRLISGRDFMEIEVMPGELTKYMKTLHKVIDIDVVVELNVLRDWIEQGDKIKLKERLETLQDLELEYSVTKLKSLIA